MRVNIYAEEMTDRVEVIGKEIDGQTYTGVRFYLELPATVNGVQHQAPFMHRPGDDDSSAVTFWGKRKLRDVLQKALAELDARYGTPSDHAAELAALAARVEEYRKDAERYRWLRSTGTSMRKLDAALFHTVSDECNPPHREMRSGSDLDAAIDSALADAGRVG